jgi:hypothetical protein
MERQLKFGLANYILRYNAADGRVIKGGQEHFTTHNEKSARDKDREAEKRETGFQVGFQVGHRTHVRKEMRKEGRAATGFRATGRSSTCRPIIPGSLADWLATRTKEIGLQDYSGLH